MFKDLHLNFCLLQVESVFTGAAYSETDLLVAAGSALGKHTADQSGPFGLGNSPLWTLRGRQQPFLDSQGEVITLLRLSGGGNTPS